MRLLAVRTMSLLAFAGARMVFPALLTAQACLGAPQLAGHIANVGGTAAFHGGGQAYAAGVSVGSSLFLMVDYAREDHVEYAQPQDTFGLGLGYEFTDEDGRFGICPTGSYALSTGIYEFRTRHAGAGVAFGFRGDASESRSIVPFGRILATRSQTHFPMGPDFEPDWAGLFVLGARVETGPAFSVGPTVSIPFAADEGEARLGTGLGISLLVRL